MSTKLNTIQSVDQEAGPSLTEEQAAQLLIYYELLTEKNKVMNLTAVTEFDDVIRKHFGDSLTLMRAVDPESVKVVLDIGTGAGFPGIPLAIAYPHMQFLLMDSLNKRIGFLNEVIAELGLKNVKTVHARAEDLAGQTAYRESFDLVVSRAVANLSTLSEYALPYVNRGGRFVSYKSIRTDEELEAASGAIRLLGGETERIVRFHLYDMDRSLIVIRKERPTPEIYPRKAGMPAREPLGMAKPREKDAEKPLGKTAKPHEKATAKTAGKTAGKPVGKKHNPIREPNQKQVKRTAKVKG